MILYMCDGCGLRHEHAGPEIPKGWAAIEVNVSWLDGKNACEAWESDSPSLLCNSCRGEDGGALTAQADTGIRRAVDRRPRETP